MSATPGWTEVATGVRVRQSAAYRMNSVAVACEGGTLLVDPGVFPAEMEDMAARIDPADELTLFFTHSHWDHILGRLVWPRAPFTAHRRFHDELREHLEHVRNILREFADEYYVRWPAEVEVWSPDVHVGEEHEWAWRGRRFIAHHVPGHAPDQAALLLPGDRLLIAADMLSDLEIPILNGTCGEYLETLGRVEAMGRHGEIETAVPGHGAVAHGWAEVEARIARDRAYLEELHRRVVAARSRRRPVEDLVEECASMDYLGKDGWPPMRKVHEKNVRRAYAALVGGVE